MTKPSARDVKSLRSLVVYCIILKIALQVLAGLCALDHSPHHLHCGYRRIPVISPGLIQFRKGFRVGL